jgi:hypothetical protein
MTESTNLSQVTPSYLTDSIGDVWGLVPSLTVGNQICYNGVIQPATAQVTLLLYNNHTVYQQNNSGSWWAWINGAWVSTANPHISAAGAAISTVGPSIIDGALNIWTLITSTAKGMQVVVNGVTDLTTADVTTLVYDNNLIYQENSFGGWWSKNSPTAAWTATTNPLTPVPPTSVTPTVPPQSLAAGYSTLVFNDDFTTTTTIANTQNVASGFNWYWTAEYQPSFNYSTWIALNTTATAASINNGNSGSNASPHGGILTLPTGKFPNANLITLPGPALNTSGAKLPALGTGRWQHCYMEAYIQFVPNRNSSVIYSSTGWPAWWAWAAEDLGGFGYGGAPFTCFDPTEVDFVESYGNAQWSGGGSGPANETNSTIINHGTNGDNGIMTIDPIDSNWHTYGFLWVPGTITMYYDNVAKGSVALSTSYSLDSQSLFMILGTGPGWPMNIDWVRVWQ